MQTVRRRQRYLLTVCGGRKLSAIQFPMISSLRRYCYPSSVGNTVSASPKAV